MLYMIFNNFLIIIHTVPLELEQRGSQNNQAIVLMKDNSYLSGKRLWK